jgi:uncharacterized protein YndB with AHSA1/START domain
MNASPDEGGGRQGRPASEYGTVFGAAAVRFERLLTGPIERVWAFLAESEKRGQWLAAGNTELWVGGRAELIFLHADLSSEMTIPERYRVEVATYEVLHGRVTRCEPPRLSSYTWPESAGHESEVTFELEARGTQVLLVLTHRRLGDRATMVSVAAGWHAHLGILDDRLAVREPRPLCPTHGALAAEYERRLPVDVRTATRSAEGGSGWRCGPRRRAARHPP